MDFSKLNLYLPPSATSTEGNINEDIDLRVSIAKEARRQDNGENITYRF